VVEDNAVERDSIVELLQHDDIEITAVGTAARRCTMLYENAFDCASWTCDCPTMNGFELLERVQQEPKLRATPVSSSPART